MTDNLEPSLVSKGCLGSPQLLEIFERHRTCDKLTHLLYSFYYSYISSVLRIIIELFIGFTWLWVNGSSIVASTGIGI